MNTAAPQSGRVTNFGANQVFQPQAAYAPASEEELLQILDANRGKRFRVIGRLHSWSAAAVAEEVLIDLRKLDDVVVHAEQETPYAEIGAGCQIKRVLAELQSQGGYTLCSLGLITEQAIAGAFSTGTHGSGRPSTSHFVLGVRLAHFDEAIGKAVIREITEGDELRAARCSLGSLGVITRARVAIRKQYMIEEHIRRYKTLEETLAKEEEFELQQFFLMPWTWDFFGQHRRMVDAPRSKLAWLYRLYWSVGMDVGLHLNIWPLAKLLPGGCTKFFFRYVAPFTVPGGWRVVDRSDRQLTIRHELFRHIEIELFVVRSKLSKALQFVTWFLKRMGGETATPPSDAAEHFAKSDFLERVEKAAGAYVHHYPICIRKVFPDDALISMSSSDGEPRYAISFISYVWPSQRDGFFRMSELLAEGLATLYGARAHWGKHCPKGHQAMPSLYPRFRDFDAVRRRLDPNGTFLNVWARGLFEAAPKESED